MYPGFLCCIDHTMIDPEPSSHFVYVVSLGFVNNLLNTISGVPYAQVPWQVDVLHGYNNFPDVPSYFPPDYPFPPPDDFERYPNTCISLLFSPPGSGGISDPTNQELFTRALIEGFALLVIDAGDGLVLTKEITDMAEATSISAQLLVQLLSLPPFLIVVPVNAVRNSIKKIALGCSMGGWATTKLIESDIYSALYDGGVALGSANYFETYGDLGSFVIGMRELFGPLPDQLDIFTQDFDIEYDYSTWMPPRDESWDTSVEFSTQFFPAVESRLAWRNTLADSINPDDLSIDWFMIESLERELSELRAISHRSREQKNRIMEIRQEVQEVLEDHITLINDAFEGDEESLQQYLNFEFLRAISGRSNHFYPPKGYVPGSGQRSGLTTIFSYISERSADPLRRYGPTFLKKEVQLTKTQNDFFREMGMKANKILHTINKKDLPPHTTPGDHLWAQTDFTGQIKKPLFQGYDLNDTIVPPWFASVYKNIVLNTESDHAELLLQKFTDNPSGHCTENPNQILTAIHATQSRIMTDIWPGPEAFPETFEIQQGQPLEWAIGFSNRPAPTSPYADGN